MSTIANCDVKRADRWIVADPEEFRAKFNRQSFEVCHNLATHPLFQLPELMNLAERTLRKRPTDLHYDAGNVRVDQRWDEIPEASFSAKEALQRVENCGAWFVFSSAQRDPEYRLFLDRAWQRSRPILDPKSIRKLWSKTSSFL